MDQMKSGYKAAEEEWARREKVEMAEYMGEESAEEDEE